MDAGPSAAILFVRRPASDARSRTLVLNPVSGGAAVTSAVILFVRGLASNARSRALVLNALSGGAAITSAVSLFVDGNSNTELGLERVNDRPGDFILECECALQLAIISFRPHAKTVSRINQFGCHTNAVTLALQTSFKHISNVEFFSNLLCGPSFQ